MHGRDHEGGGPVPPRLDTASEAAAAAAAAAAAVCEAKAIANVKAILNNNKNCDEGMKVKVPIKEQKEQQPLREASAGSMPGDADATTAAKTKTGCECVPAAPPSELKYGDRLRLWVRYAGKFRCCHDPPAHWFCRRRRRRFCTDIAPLSVAHTSKRASSF